MLECCEEVIAAERPDWTLVYGDTNSTLAGALAAAKLRIPLAHVEAGLRSFNRDMPEELNRVVADQLSDILFAPTEVAVANLCREGVAAARIRMVGDVMLDSALYYATRITPGNDAAGRLSVAGFALATVHRAENADVPERLANIVGALRQLCDAVPVVFPMHPRTRARLAGSGVDLGRIRVIEPVGYLDMLALLKAARLVVTDSGGLQKEAYFFGRPCVTLRAETEWGELVDAGWNVLAGTDPSLIVASAMRMLGDRMPEQRNLYGDGTAAQRIVQTLLGRE
jgi:UDP-GlcNAc3NAcA epimerase